MRNLLRMGCVMLGLAVLAACSSIPRAERDRQALERYKDYAGAPVNSFTYLGRFTGFQTLSQYQMVVFTGVNDAYLLTLMPPCSGLQFANDIAFTSRTRTIYSRFDEVRFDRERCRISEIRPVNYREMKKAMREEKEGT